MKKLLLILSLLLAPTQLLAIPKLVHVVTNPTVDSAGSISSYILRLPQAMLNNNGGVAVINAPAGFAPTSCTDDKSVAWTASVVRANGDQQLSSFYTLGRTDGPQVLTCVFAAPHTFISGVLIEFTGVLTAAALDKTCGDSFFATEVDCSTAATTTAGQLIIGVATQTDTAATLNGWTAGTGYTLGGGDNLDSMYVVYQVQSATGVAQPLINFAPATSQHGIMVGLTFKAAASGTDLSGMMIANMYQMRFKTGDTAPVFNVACRGDENTIIGIWNGAAGRIITGTAPLINITSTGTTGTWKQNGSGSVFGGSGKNQYVYLENTTCGPTTTITPTFSGGQALDSYIIWLTIVNGATTLADPSTPTSATGTDATGNPFTGSSLTVTNAGIVITYMGAATGSGSQVVCSPGVFINPQTVPVIDTNPVGENQGACIKTVAASETYTVTWTPNSIAIGTYADYTAGFNSAGGGGGSGNSVKSSLTSIGVSVP